MPNLNKKEWNEYRVGKLKVILVNGTAVRVKDVSFTMGGHNLVYSYVPKGEIWIADELSEYDRKCTLLHEFVEVRWMAQGMKYDDAHIRANSIEGKARHGGDVDKMLKNEMVKLPPILEPSIYNGAKHLVTEGSDLHHTHKMRKHHRNLMKQEKGIGIIKV
jgi:hypothetical protein